MLLVAASVEVAGITGVLTLTGVAVVETAIAVIQDWDKIGE